eukprot:TRINITY_DN5880_c0_g1_i1.p1 TRINITY_DN5880_c0_g1~~TRINITY_DN5880_c0_g1_i1.p1  ORF type:complete len:196 (-),score=35.24 TRINITY_DN5880_c0_g1_i1:100-642(-)
MDSVQFAAYLFSAQNEGGEFVLKAEPDLEPLANIYLARIQEGNIPLLTQTLCSTVADMIGMIRTALQQSPGSIYTPSLTLQDNVLPLSIRANLGYCQKEFSINIQPAAMHLKERLDRIERLIGTRTNDFFSTDDSRHHPNLRIFHNGLVMVKYQGGESHDSASLVNAYLHGQHYTTSNSG